MPKIDKIQLQQAVKKWKESTELHNVSWIHDLGVSAQAVLSGEVLSVSEIEKIIEVTWCNRMGSLTTNYERFKEIATAIHNAMGGEK